jgi:hypothetical protein
MNVSIAVSMKSNDFFCTALHAYLRFSITLQKGCRCLRFHTTDSFSFWAKSKREIVEGKREG